VADAQIEAVRVRRWRLDLMQQHLAPLLLEDPDDVPACELRRDAEVSLKKAFVLSDLTPQLQLLDQLRTARRVASQ
jgi:hypothetical protein